MNGQPPLILQSPAPKRTGWIVYAVILTFLFFVSVLANFGLLALVAGTGAGETRVGGRRAYYEENFVEGDEDSRNKIAVISLTGVITDSGDGYGREGGMVES